MRVLAIDLGSKRVGLALSDETAMIAQPLDTVPAAPVSGLPERLGALARDLGVGELVVGLPKRLDGSQGPEAKAARALAGRLQEITGLPVALLDERMTTAAAERALLSTGMKRAGRRSLTDRVAAALILQDYLERRRRRGQG